MKLEIELSSFNSAIDKYRILLMKGFSFIKERQIKKGLSLWKDIFIWWDIPISHDKPGIFISVLQVFGVYIYL